MLSANVHSSSSKTVWSESYIIIAIRLHSRPCDLGMGAPILTPELTWVTTVTIRGYVANRHNTFNIRVSVYFSGTLNRFCLTRQCHIPAFIKILTHRTRFEIEFATLFLSPTYVLFNSSITLLTKTIVFGKQQQINKWLNCNKKKFANSPDMGTELVPNNTGWGHWLKKSASIYFGFLKEI